MIVCFLPTSLRDTQVQQQNLHAITIDARKLEINKLKSLFKITFHYEGWYKPPKLFIQLVGLLEPTLFIAKIDLIDCKLF